MDSTGLVIGPGFQQWVSEHNATPLSDELYWSREISAMMCKVSVGGADTHVLLMYNKISNEIVPFVEASL